MLKRDSARDDSTAQKIYIVKGVFCECRDDTGHTPPYLTQT